MVASDAKQKRKRRRYWLSVGVVFLVIVAVVMLIGSGFSQSWTGFNESTTVSIETTDSQGNKVTTQIYQRTLWDWMGLLIVPSVLGVGVFLLNRSEQRRQAEVEEQRHEEDRQQAYLDQMTTLLKEGLRKSSSEAEVRQVARTRTLTVFRNVDGERKGILLRFLHDSELVHNDSLVISLYRANLSGADLDGADLSGANLSEANLRKANLRGADLHGANISGADLRGADLHGADLRGADLRKADLGGADVVNMFVFSTLINPANLSKANLSKADLSVAILRGANLSGVDLSEANLSEANLSEADLSSAEMRGADLSKADLRDAGLNGANLNGADLRGANLRGTALLLATSDDSTKFDSFDPIAARAKNRTKKSCLRLVLMKMGWRKRG